MQEIPANQLEPERFIEEQVQAIRGAVGEGRAINALSGGVDSSTVTMLGHRALGPRLRSVFVENGTFGIFAATADGNISVNNVIVLGSDGAPGPGADDLTDYGANLATATGSVTTNLAPFEKSPFTRSSTQNLPL